MSTSTITTGMPRHARGAISGCAMAVTVLLGACACQSVGPAASAGPSSPSAGASTPATPAATIEVTPADGATSVRPDAPITVKATAGTLRTVTVTSAAGEVAGELDEAKTTWLSAQLLRPKTRYQVTATAVNQAGDASTSTATIHTLTPKDSATYGLIPSGSGAVGVGMPVVVQFVSPVDTDKRAEVERRVSVTSTPQMKGAWGWLDGRQLIFRPATYWKPGSKVSVKADIAGIETKKGLWTTRNASTTFSVGSAMVSTVNTKTHKMTVTRNGKLLRVLNVSTGRPGSDTETRRGTKVILSRESLKVMDSATIGIKKGSKGYYRIPTQWAMRLTWSGEFVHSAPWSVGSQGSANVSHGCTNLSPSDARWLFDQSKVGDLFKFTGSARGLEEYNGYTMWNQSLSSWAAKSAL